MGAKQPSFIIDPPESKEVKTRKAKAEAMLGKGAKPGIK